ncbi:hypothetical protein SAY86_005417 [Trapa natans]|uniref:Serine aminopeptidase S33 domain-containing protein n=1 Tax=Trapa natans TaxID=22666 RepID=A0AAN7L3E5_TRANT|nr:hypothetical protein SAY86_005417 [Trapa natans]
MEGSVTDSPYRLLLRAVSLIPASHFFVAALFSSVIFLYSFLEAHFLHDLLNGFRGDPVSINCDSSSRLFHSIVSKCRTLHGRYLATPWLCSPHLQTAFLSFMGRSPDFIYRRQLFHTSDRGTIALDWLLSSDVMEDSASMVQDNQIHDETPILIVIPGLTSDSESSYIKHLVYTMARSGWNVVVSNHRGLGGITITSDCFYNAGWTKDIEEVVNHLHQHHLEASLFVVGTSIGANVLVKYLGEQGENVPIMGAAAICSPWDLLICDRFINRRPVQKMYDKVLTIGLQGYAKLHQTIMSRLANWDGIVKSRSVREFDNHATRILGKYETVDTFYRRCSSSIFVGKVSVPLLCISALDDPVCTSEAIPWDECRANKNIVLATTPHGGHLGFYEGITARRLWWVRAVSEFLGILQSSQSMRRRAVAQAPLPSALESSVDQGPYINVDEDGMVAAVGDEQANCTVEDTTKDTILTQPSVRYTEEGPTPIKAWLSRFSRPSNISIALLAYIAMVTTWPLIGPALLLAIKRKFKKGMPSMALKRS